MIDLLIWSIIFAGSLALLIKSSDVFTDSAGKLGVLLGMPSYLVGILIVAVGTSLPELASSISAVISGSSEVVIGNVVGSNISNIALVIGVAALYGNRLPIRREVLQRDLPILLGSALLITILILDGTFSFWDALFCLAALILYIRATVNGAKHVPPTDQDGKGTQLLLLALTAGGIFLGAHFAIEGLVHIADILSFGAEIIAVTALALGTSLPELSVTIHATRKGQQGMAVGNVIGSNIFNTFAIMIIVTVLMYVMSESGKVTKTEGGMFLIFYAAFIYLAILG